jgi:glutamyl-tRNA synthetase
MTKPLDSLKDLVIVRSDGSPVFHIANVVDDITQGVTHIIRGDDHVENTFKHIMLFACLGEKPPQYAHLPMIVNAAGKPYSKRDGDAFVGDFRTKGYLADALVNYLALLGWSPGDDREKMSRQELTEAFSLERCQRGSAQMDIRKLTNLNGLYMAELPEEEFFQSCLPLVRGFDWGAEASESQVRKVCRLMHSRLKTYGDIAGWDYFFRNLPVYDERSCQKQFKDGQAVEALKVLLPKLEALDCFSAADLEAAVEAVAAEFGLGHGKLNQPLRAAVTGTGIGAGIFETMELLGRECCLKRMEYALGTVLPATSA